MTTLLRAGELRQARIAVAASFLLHAAVFGSWAPRIPALKAELDLGNDDLGLALGGMAVGLFVGTRLVGGLERRGRTRMAIRLLVAAQAVALIGPAYAWNLGSLSAVLFVLGMLGGALDVVMNAHAVAVERLYRRPIMSGFHGLWSLGSMGAGATAALAASVQLDLRVHFALAAAVCVVASWPLLRGLLRADVESATNGHHVEHPQGSGRPVGVLVVAVLAAMGFGAFLGEGAVADWSAVFLHDERGAPAGVAALGFTLFSAAMAASRLVADRIGMRVGPVAVARGGALLASAGYLVFLLVPAPLVALIGFVVTGLGIGPIVPVVFSAAGNTRTANRASVLSIAVSAGYLGAVVGPMAIGWVAAHVGLGWALSAPMGFLVVVALAAGLLRSAAGRGPAPEEETHEAASTTR